ncbi:hypothetical protein C1H46_038442 [Malus baccata]|uniref:Thioredoxin domain-containing protein n=1 Tax=Malus baccata TaxID=106549 RepID=A0A540KPD5_MALBA|nr:hypothetical protein C1H46_038442 [Malus baccata]
MYEVGRFVMVLNAEKAFDEIAKRQSKDAAGNLFDRMTPLFHIMVVCSQFCITKGEFGNGWDPGGGLAKFLGVMLCSKHHENHGDKYPQFLIPQLHFINHPMHFTCLLQVMQYEKSTATCEGVFNISGDRNSFIDAGNARKLDKVLNAVDSMLDDDGVEFFTNPNKKTMLFLNLTGESSDVYKSTYREVAEKYKKEGISFLIGDLKVLVTDNIQEYAKSGKYVLLEFYAPWCGHCKKFPILHEVAVSDEKDSDVVIAILRAIVNGVPSDFDVKYFQQPQRLQDQMLAHLCLKFRKDWEELQQQEPLDSLPKTICSIISHYLFYSLINVVYLFHGVSNDLLFPLVSEMKAIGITSFAKAPMEFLSPVELQLRMACILFYSWVALFMTDPAIHDRIKGIITSMNAQIPYFKKIFSMITNHLTSFLNSKIEVNLPLKKDGTTTASILVLLLDGMHFKKYLEFLQNLEEIIEALDGIKVAGVDLGVEIPLEHIPTVPEKITNVYRELNKLVTVAYQFLELVIEYPTPTLGKVVDVSEAVRQYAFNIVRSNSLVESLFDAFNQQWFSVKLIYAFCCLLILILGIVGMRYVVNLVGGSKEPIKLRAAIESIALVLAYFTNKRIITLLLYYGGRIGYGEENRERLLGKWEVVDVNYCCSCALYLVDSEKIYGKHLYNAKNFHVEGSSIVSSRKPVIFADETCATQTAALGNANFAPIFVQGSLTSMRNR